MRSFVATLIAVICLTGAAPEAEAATDSVKILLITRLGVEDVSYRANRMADAIRDKTGLRAEFIVREYAPDDPREKIAISAKTAIGRDRADLVFGLTLDDVRLLEEFDMLRPVSQERIGHQRSRALYVTGTAGRAQRSVDPDSVLAVPLELSIPVLCYDRERVGYLAEFRPSIFEIAFGKLSQRLALPDPRSDEVGRAILLAAFDAAGGVKDGWSLVEELDRAIVEYSYSAFHSCEAVREGRAEIGFTNFYGLLVAEDRGTTLGYQMLDRVPLAPFSFAAALANPEPSREDAIYRVLRWVVEQRIDDDIAVLDFSLGKRGWEYDTRAMAEPRGPLEYLPIDRLVSEWAARYDYRLERNTNR